MTNNSLNNYLIQENKIKDIIQSAKKINIKFFETFLNYYELKQNESLEKIQDNFNCEIYQIEKNQLENQYKQLSTHKQRDLLITVKKFTDLILKEPNLKYFQDEPIFLKFYLSNPVYDNVLKFSLLIISGILQRVVTPKWGNTLSDSEKFEFSEKNAVQALVASLRFDIIRQISSLIIQKKIFIDDLKVYSDFENKSGYYSYINELAIWHFNLSYGEFFHITADSKKNKKFISRILVILELLCNDNIDFMKINTITTPQGETFYTKKYITILFDDSILFKSLINIERSYPRIYPSPDWELPNKEISNISEYPGKEPFFNKLFLGKNRSDKLFLTNLLEFKVNSLNKSPVLEIINKLQKTPFKINLDVLLFILNKFDILQNMELLQKEPDKRTIRELNREASAYAADILYNKYLSKYILEKNILEVATNFIFFKDIYWNYALDSRGRLYNTEYPLSPQGSSLAKSLISFSNNFKIFFTDLNSLNSWVIYGLTVSEQISKIDYFDISSNIKFLKSFLLTIDEDNIFYYLKKLKDPWPFLAFYFEFKQYLNAELDGSLFFNTSILTNIDATSSSFQIFSCLTKDTKMSKQCNVLNFDKKPEDVYLNLVKKTFEKYIINIPYESRQEVKITNFDKTNNSASIQNLNLSLTEWTSLQNMYYDDYFLKMVIRKAVKHFAMSYGPYSMSAKTGFERIYEALKLQDRFTLNQIKFFRAVFYRTLKEACIFQKKLSLNLALVAKKVSDKALLIDSSLTSSGVVLDFNDLLKVHVHYNIVKKYKIRYNLLGGKQVSMTFKEESAFNNISLKNNKEELIKKYIETDSKKMISAFPPNFTHHLDSIILYRTLIDFYKKTNDLAPICTNHDCFNTPTIFFEQLRKSYKTAFIETFKDPLNDIYLKMLIDNDILTLSFLNEFEKTLVDKNFNIEDIWKSNFILL